MPDAAEKEKFLQLIGVNRGIIVKICHSYCTLRIEREDLSQEIIYQLWRSWPRYDPGQRFSTWMYRVALNVAISFYRKTKTAYTVEELSEAQLHAAEPDTENEDNLARLQNLIRKLKELDKALMLLYLDARPYREIAGILGITETNVASRISRIKEKLKQELSKTTKP